MEVFECVKGQIPALGYTQTSIDVEDHRITARKYDKEARYADSRFRRMIERSRSRSRAPPKGARS